MTVRTEMTHRLVGILVVLLTVGTLSAQDMRVDPETGQREVLQFHLGAYGALNINFHTANFGALPGTPSCCPEYNNATSLTPALGGLMELSLTREWRLQLRAGLSSLSGELTDRRVIGNEPVLSDGPVPIGARRDIEVDYYLDASIPLLTIEPAAGFRALDWLWLYAGVRGSLMMGSSFEQREVLAAPDGYVFAGNGTTVRNAVSGSIPEAQSVQLHGAFGLGYELNLSRNIMLVPEVRYYLPFTKVSSVDWTVQSFQMGASVRYSIYRPVDPTIIYDTIFVRDTVVEERRSIAEERVVLRDSDEDEAVRREGDYQYRTVTVRQHYVREVPRPFDPVVTIDGNGVGPNGEQLGLDMIRVKETDVVESYPLLPQVFFAEDSSSLSSTRMQVLDASNARDFRTTDLMRDQFDVYHNILNIIGERMKADPSAKLSLTGTTANTAGERNNRALAQARAESVRSYLVDVWGIDRSRISVGARLLPSNPANSETDDGRAENRRVEIAANNDRILETVEFRDRDRSVDPKEITFLPRVDNGDDVAGWSLNVRQANNELFSTSGDGMPSTVQWKTEGDRRPKLDLPIVTTLTVRNDRGQEKSVTKSVPVDLITLQKAKATQEGGKIIERYSLIVFDYNSAKLNDANQRIMDAVRARVRPDSKVRIMGFADRTGDPEYNRKLAQRRCEEARRVLNVADAQVTVEPVGSDRLIYANETPEGRSYCRTVQIEIETPVRE